jgi:hypothetical protein
LFQAAFTGKTALCCRLECKGWYGINIRGRKLKKSAISYNIASRILPARNSETEMTCRVVLNWAEGVDLTLSSGPIVIYKASWGEGITLRKVTFLRLIPKGVSTEGCLPAALLAFEVVSASSLEKDLGI